MDSQKRYDVIRAKNGRGVSNLLIVTDPAIPDIYIGSALMVPIADGYKDPLAVTIIMGEDGLPLRTNLDTCVVLQYHYN
jgi:hypothetical protein